MTHDISKHPYWTRDEFMAFLLFYGANADMECTEEERQMIIRTIPEGHLPDVEKEYNRLSDFERIEVMQAYRSKYFATDVDKEKVINTLKSLLMADGEYDIMEQNLVMMLHRLL